MKMTKNNLLKTAGVGILSIIILIIVISLAKPTKEIDVASEELNRSKNIESIEVNKEEGNQTKPENALKRLSDIRALPFLPSDWKNFNIIKEDIETFTFNEGTDLGEYNDYAKELLEKGKNPGLGVREIHEAGITGKGVRVAIIDQNLCLNHPEFKGKIVEYFDSGCNQPNDSGSMHGPAVASLLVGKTIGTAPGALLYYAAAPSWTGDSKYYADSLRWIIEKNVELPENDKIRVVSVSAAPSGNESPFTKNNEEWDKAVIEAKENGIFVLDVTGFVGPCYYDINDPDNIEKVKSGFLDRGSSFFSQRFILVPCSLRTVAEEYTDGYPSYQYTGQGGISWSIPYAAGVMALGWEIKPELSPDEIIKILWDTVYISKSGSKIINPPAFIKKIQEMP